MKFLFNIFNVISLFCRLVGVENDMYHGDLGS